MSIWAQKTSTAPVIIQVVALPTLSTRAPKSGVKSTGAKAIIEIITEAVESSRPKRGMMIEVPNFLKLITQQ